MKGRLVYWPTGESYYRERFRVVLIVGRDAIIQNVRGDRFTVDQRCLLTVRT